MLVIKNNSSKVGWSDCSGPECWVQNIFFDEVLKVQMLFMSNLSFGHIINSFWQGVKDDFFFIFYWQANDNTKSLAVLTDWAFWGGWFATVTEFIHIFRKIKKSNPQFFKYCQTFMYLIRGLKNKQKIIIWKVYINYFNHK